MENWPFLREGQLNKDGGWKQKQTNCSSEYSWEVEWLRAIQITRNRREGIVPLIPVRLSFILEQYCATCSVLDYIAECFEAESLKEVSLAAAAHFDRQTLIRVEKFSGLKKTLNNFNVQTKLWVVPVEQFQIMWKKRACELKIIRENRARVTSKFSHIAHTAGNSLSHTHTHMAMHIHTNLQSLLLKKVLYQNTVPENVMDTLPKGEHTYTLAHINADMQSITLKCYQTKVKSWVALLRL